MIPRDGGGGGGGGGKIFCAIVLGGGAFINIAEQPVEIINKSLRVNSTGKGIISMGRRIIL